MKPRTTSPHRSPARLPEDYASLCRKVWLPRPIRDKHEHTAAHVRKLARHFALPADFTSWSHEQEAARKKTRQPDISASLLR